MTRGHGFDNKLFFYRKCPAVSANRHFYIVVVFFFSRLLLFCFFAIHFTAAQWTLWRNTPAPIARVRASSNCKDKLRHERPSIVAVVVAKVTAL